jgi:membrane protease YdiL (CAAX protease family)
MSGFRNEDDWPGGLPGDGDPQGDSDGTPSGVLALALVFEGGLLALALLLGWLLDQPPLQQLSWSPTDAIVGVAATAPPLALYLVMMRWPLGSLRRIKEILEEMVRPLFAPATVPDLAAIALLAGLSEEALFRGVVQGALAAWLGNTAALLLASLAFGLAHCVTATYVVIAAVMGLYLGWIWLLTGNLLTVIVAHAVYDFVVLLHIRRGKRERPE